MAAEFSEPNWTENHLLFSPFSLCACVYASELNTLLQMYINHAHFEKTNNKTWMIYYDFFPSSTWISHKKTGTSDLHTNTFYYFLFCRTALRHTNCKYYVCSPDKRKRNFHNHVHSISPSLVWYDVKKKTCSRGVQRSVTFNRSAHHRRIVKIEKVANIIQNTNKNNKKHRRSSDGAGERKQNKLNGFFSSYFFYSNAAV